MKMSREQFKELMGLEESDMGMEMADECYNDIGSWWEVAKGIIAGMNILLLEQENEIQD